MCIRDRNAPPRAGLAAATTIPGARPRWYDRHPLATGADATGALLDGGAQAAAGPAAAFGFGNFGGAASAGAPGGVGARWRTQLAVLGRDELLPLWEALRAREHGGAGATVRGLYVRGVEGSGARRAPPRAAGAGGGGGPRASPPQLSAEPTLLEVRSEVARPFPGGGRARAREMADLIWGCSPVSVGLSPSFPPPRE